VRVSVCSVLRVVVGACAGALCFGGTSESVRMQREMVVQEVGRGLALGCYICACQ